jgi:RNA polymerase sigma-70 factor (sigma-E family)
MTSPNDDEKAFAEYFAARQDSVRRTAYLLCGDWHWADDLTQAAFIRLASAWHTVRDRGALDGFVRTCLLRSYLAESQRVWRRRERTYADPPDTAMLHDTTEETGLRMVFQTALGRLSPRQRATLVCRFYQGLDVEQTATALGCSTGTVKSQTARGVAALRDVLGDQLTQVMEASA